MNSFTTKWREIFDPNIPWYLINTNLPSTPPEGEAKKLVARHIIHRSSFEDTNIPTWVKDVIYEAASDEHPILIPEAVKLAVIDNTIHHWKSHQIEATDTENKNALHHLFLMQERGLQPSLDLIKNLNSSKALIEKDRAGKLPLDYLNWEKLIELFTTAPSQNDEINTTIARYIVLRPSLQAENLPQWTTEAIQTVSPLDPVNLKLAVMNGSILSWESQHLEQTDANGNNALHHIFCLEGIDPQLVKTLVAKLASETALTTKNSEGFQPLDYLMQKCGSGLLLDLADLQNGVRYPGSDNANQELTSETSQPALIPTPTAWLAHFCSLDAYDTILKDFFRRFGYEALLPVDFHKLKTPMPLAVLEEKERALPMKEEVKKGIEREIGIRYDLLLFLSGAFVTCSNAGNELNTWRPNRARSKQRSQWEIILKNENGSTYTFDKVAHCLLTGEDIPHEHLIQVYDIGLRLRSEKIISHVQNQIHKISENPFDLIKVWHGSLKFLSSNRDPDFEAAYPPILEYLKNHISLSTILTDTLNYVIDNIYLLANQALLKHFLKMLQEQNLFPSPLPYIDFVKLTSSKHSNAPKVLDAILETIPEYGEYILNAIDCWENNPNKIQLINSINKHHITIPQSVLYDTHKLLYFSALMPENTTLSNALELLPTQKPLDEPTLAKLLMADYTNEGRERMCSLLETHYNLTPQFIQNAIINIVTDKSTIKLENLIVERYDWKDYFLRNQETLKKILMAHPYKDMPWIAQVAEFVQISEPWYINKSKIRQVKAFETMTQDLFTEARNRKLPFTRSSTFKIREYYIVNAKRKPGGYPKGAIEISKHGKSQGWGVFTFEGLTKRLEYLDQCQGMQDRIRNDLGNIQGFCELQYEPFLGRECKVMRCEKQWNVLTKTQVRTIDFDFENPQNTIDRIKSAVDEAYAASRDGILKSIKPLIEKARNYKLKLALSDRPNIEKNFVVTLSNPITEEAPPTQSTTIENIIAQWPIQPANGIRNSLEDIDTNLNAAIENHCVSKYGVLILRNNVNTNSPTFFESANTLASTASQSQSSKALLTLSPGNQVKRTLVYHTKGNRITQLVVEPHEELDALDILDAIAAHLPDNYSLNPNYLNKTKVNPESQNKPQSTSSSSTSSSSSSSLSSSSSSSTTAVSVLSYDDAAKILTNILPQLQPRLSQIREGKVNGMIGDSARIESAQALKEDFTKRLAEVVTAIKEKDGDNGLVKFARDLNSHSNKCTTGLDDQLNSYWQIYCAKKTIHNDPFRKVLDSAIWRAVDLLQDVATQQRDQTTHLRTWLRLQLTTTHKDLNPDPQAGNAMQSGQNDHYIANGQYGGRDFPAEFSQNYFRQVLVPYLILRLDQCQNPQNPQKRVKVRQKLMQSLEDAIIEKATEGAFGQHIAQIWVDKQNEVEGQISNLRARRDMLQDQINSTNFSGAWGEVKQIQEASDIQLHTLVREMPNRGQKRSHEETTTSSSSDSEEDRMGEAKRQYVRKQQEQITALFKLFEQDDHGKVYSNQSQELAQCKEQINQLITRKKSWEKIVACYIINKLGLSEEVADDFDDSLTFKGLIYLVCLRGMVDGLNAVAVEVDETFPTF